MVQFVAMAKVLVLFIYLLMVLFFEASCRLEYFCTNNQDEYEALLFGLEMLLAIGATHIEAFGDSL
jgi:ribonuclease HI